MPTPPPTSKRSRSATTGQNYSRREGRTEFCSIGEFLGYVEDFHDRLYVFEHDLSIRRIRFEKDIGGLKYDRRELERSERQLNVRGSKVEKREGDVTTREMALQAETERAYNKHRDYEREKFSSQFNEERRMHQQKLERLQEDGKRYQQKLRESEVVRQQEREALEEKLKIAGEEKKKAQRLIQALKQKHEAMGMDMSEIEQTVSAS